MRGIDDTHLLVEETPEIVYSTDPQEIGRFNKNDYFFQIVTKGKTYSKMIVKGKSTFEGEMTFIDVVETYVPIITNDAALAKPRATPSLSRTSMPGPCRYWRA